MKAGVDLTAAVAGFAGLDDRKQKRSNTGVLVFSLFATRLPAKAGRQIDAGSVTLHPDFMSCMTSW